MASLVVQSRFAGLKIEDDDYPPNDNEKSKKNKPTENKRVEPPKKTKNNGNKSQPTFMTVQKKRKSKGHTASDDQWEMWKQKDEELVDGHYESELQQAIMLSKLDYEEKKDVYKQKKPQPDKTAPDTPRAGNKKPKKKNVMSLDQFNDMVDGEEAKCNNHVESPKEQKPPEKDTQFFERVKDITKNTVLKDKMNDRVKNRLSVSDETITRVKFADALEKKDKEIAELKEEISSLKQELLTVKSRNKKLYNILGHGEMKDKAEILVEVERLRTEQAELTAELASLHTDLEKERSKNAEPVEKRKTNREKKHPTKKKNIKFDVSSEALLTKETSSGTA
ncbi:G kinase-anchoring protein 1-like [Epargyreus clarus]|uniref:G kinase-anchoring protein 1-like n=1 Tax=Epargyreus clarus TaxID=520877 RepID=UPI003C2FC23E